MRASLTDILARKSACVCRVGGQVGEDHRAYPARGERSYSCDKLNGEVAGHADILARILARKSARTSVSVSVPVSVPWNSSSTRRRRVKEREREMGANSMSIIESTKQLRLSLFESQRTTTDECDPLTTYSNQQVPAERDTRICLHHHRHSTPPYVA